MDLINPIGKLEMRCGACDLTEYCGYGYGYAVCSDGRGPLSPGRFSDVTQEQFKEIAEKAPIFERYPECVNCSKYDKDQCGEDGSGIEECGHLDASRNHYCHQLADYVAKELGYA